jgi:hypothetical protein
VPLYAFWHAKILVLAHAYRGRGVHVLISRNRDGEIIARIVRRMGYGTLRGSTSRGGAAALLEVIRALREGIPVAITPDGPRGPMERVQAGIVAAARETRSPVLCMGAAAHPSTRLASWDGFLVPHPGARALVSIAPPVTLDPGGDPDQQAAALEAYMKANEDHAHAQLARWVLGEGEPRPYGGPVPPGLAAWDRGEAA